MLTTVLIYSDPLSDTGTKLRNNVPIFKEDREGNIVIQFYTIDGEMIMYEKTGNGKMSHLTHKAYSLDSNKA